MGCMRVSRAGSCGPKCANARGGTLQGCPTAWTLGTGGSWRSRRNELCAYVVEHLGAAGGVLVIDDDLRTSGASAGGRAGFQRLVAEVVLGRVGIILGMEMSRLSRSCRD